MTGTSQAKGQPDGGALSKAVIGTYEEGLKIVGRKSDVHTADFSATEAITQFFAGSIEDANPSYWDAEYAEAQWGGIVAPMGLLATLSKALPWRPGGVETRRNIVFSVPLPGATVINASAETEFFRPILLGDRISSYDEVSGISPEKTTRLGTGHFVTVVTTYLNQNGEIVARNTNNVFRFIPHEKGDA
ncbi:MULTISPECIES: FAS1-like dehydratase domain-containing protein [Sphingopyxis]|uniref:FAS1-like dehydratase domain-containing protein n=1 Tax=Sphingopyxis TaxID=165697 RepID=UPI00082D0B7F|nr:MULTISPECIES: MaoC family dehydratase N-terminal domain-containing protein [Sphingopyxis]